MSMADEFRQKHGLSMADSLRQKHGISMADQIKQKHGLSMADRIRQKHIGSTQEDQRGLSAQEVAEAKANKHYGSEDWRRVLGGDNIDAAVSFAKGFTHNFDEYAASLNKSLGKVADAVLPKKYNTGFFNENAAYWDKKRKQNEIETEDHKTAKLAGEIILDPINLTPAGVFTKGGKVARVAKSAAAGVPVGYATSAVKNYGNTELTDSQKATQNRDSAVLVGILNGVIAGLTKGKVQNAFKDMDEFGKAAADGKEEAVAAIKALKENPEVFGLSKANASGVLKQYDELVHGDGFTMVGDAIEHKQQPIELNIPQNIKNALGIDTEKAEAHLELLRRKHPEVFKDDKEVFRLIRDVLSDATHVVRGTGKNNAILLSRIDDKLGKVGLDRTSVPALIVHALKSSRKNEFKRLLKKQLEGSPTPSLPLNGTAAHGANAHSTAYDEIIPQTTNDSQINFDDPLVQHVIERGKNRTAQQTRYDKVRVIDRNIRHVNNGHGWENQIDKEVYTENPEFDFTLTKSDVKEIEKGNITPEIEAKIRQDVSTMENHPDWMDEAAAIRGEKPTAYDDGVHIDEHGNLLDADGNELFANAGHNLAIGFGTGTANAAGGLFDGSYDQNRDISEQMAERFIEGMAAGMLGTHALRLLKKQHPEAFAKVQRYFLDSGVKPGDDLSKHRGVKLGVFAGEKAKGFEAATNKHSGKYDGFTRFEIDDSTMNVKKPELQELMSKNGNTKKLSDVIDHPELFDNYPELKNVDVKFDKNLGSNAAFDGHNTITISDKFNDVDDVSSSLIHEIQHWVQGKEGFAGGGSFTDMVRSIESKIDELERRGELSQLDAMHYADELDHLKNNKTDAAFDKYKKIAGEIEAREVQARQHLTPEERNIIPPYENTSTLADNPEAYNTAFMAELEGRHKDFDSVGIAPEDATLDFSRSRQDSFSRQSNRGKLSHLDRLTNEEINKTWKDISKTLTGHARLLFRDTFSGEYMKARDITTAAKHKAANDASMLHNTLKKLPEADRTALHEYIVGDVSPGSVSPDIRAIGDNIRQTITDIQQQLIDAGYPEEMITAWGDNYLKRIYERHFNKEFVGVMTKKMTIPQLLRRGKQDILKEEDYKNLIETGAIDESMIGVPLKDGGIDVKDLGDGRYMVRRDWTKAEREQMGEITDASITIPQTIVHLNTMLEHAKFLKEVSNVDGAVLDPAVAKTLDDKEISAIGYVRVPKDKRYGALSGQVVRKDVFGDVKALNDNVFDTYFGSDNKIAGAWKKYIQLWKKSKTVWNAPTHLNNLTSNFFLMHLAGLNPAEIIGNGISAWKMMLKGKRLTELESKKILGTLTDAERNELTQLNDDLKYYIEAKDLGLLNTSFVEDIGHSAGEVTGGKGMLGKADKTLTRWYQNEDGVNKLAMFKFLRENGWSKEKSRQAVEMIMPDYSRPMAQGWRFLRDTGVTPFIAWTYYTFPKMFNLIKTFRGGVQAATALGALYGLQYATTGTFNPLSDDMPDDFQGSRIGISSDGDNVTTVKMDRIIPYLQPMNLVRFGRDFATGSPFATAVSAAAGVKLYNGRPVTSDYKPKAQQTYDYVKYIAQGLTPIPGEVSHAWDLVESLAREKKNRKTSSDIVPRTPLQEALKLVGINSMTYNKRRLEQKRKREEINALKRLMRQ